MNIIGEKIILRAMEEKDTELLLSIINDPEIEYLLGGWSFPVSSQNQIDWFNSLKYTTSEMRCVIEIKELAKAIGVVMLTEIDYKNGNAEIHIKLVNTECRRKGFASEVIRCMVQYAFEELRLHAIYARVSEHNVASKSLFEKCGFVIEGLLKERLYKRGKYINVLSYSIINNDIRC